MNAVAEPTASIWAQFRTYRGWSVVLVGMIYLMFVVGAPVMILKVSYGPMIDDMSWTRSQTTAIISYKWFTAAVIGLFFMGPLIQKFGLRVIMVTTAIVNSAALAGFLFVQSLPLFYALGIVLGLTGTAGMISVKIMVSRWFSRNQGFAIGVALIGMSIAGVILPLVATELIHVIGWRATLAISGLGTLFIALPVALWRAGAQPTDEEILTEAMRSGGPDTVQASAQDLKDAELDMSFKEILRTRMFWMIAVSLFLAGAVDNGLLQHTVLFVDRDLELGDRVAALTLSATFALGILAKVGFGWVYDKLSIQGIAICYGLLGLATFLALPVSGVLTLILFTTARGLSHGGLILETPVLAKHCYGPKFMNKMMPVFTGIMTLGYAVGPLVLSMVHDRTGSYHFGIILFGIMPLVGGAILLLGVKPLYRSRLKAILSQDRIPAAAAPRG